jgi:hypothetical protein
MFDRDRPRAGILKGVASLIEQAAYEGLSEKSVKLPLPSEEARCVASPA